MSEGKEAADWLARSEARLAEAQRIAHIGSWEWDVASDVVHWTDELYRIYGLRQGEFAGTYEAFLERVLPEDRDHTRAVVLSAFRDGAPFVYDHRIVRADEAIRTLYTRGEAMTDAHGKVVRMAGACWDITEIRETTRELDRSISLLRATLESTADGLLVVDRSGKVAAYNQRLLDLWEIPRELVDQADFDTLLDFVHDQIENGEECLQRVRALAAQPQAESFDALRFRDGRFFERYSRPQWIGAEIVGRVWSYRDVTERERLLQGALFLADASRLLASLEVEKALEAMAHLALSCICDACAVDLVTDGEQRRLLSLSRDPKKTIAGELPRSILSGTPAIYSVGSTSYMAVPLRARGDLLGALGFAARGDRRYSDADLALATELARRVELALENGRLYRSAREALTARDEFLSVAAHEIRGPVTSLHLAVQGLQLGPPAAVATTMMEIIKREDRRIGRFVDELLDAARIRSGQLSFVFAPVDLVEVTREVAARLAPELARAGSSLSLTAPVEIVGTWDRLRLDQIVANLLSNAIKFGQGRPIELRIEGGAGTARLVVRDHGIGIAAEAQRRIFAPFERVATGPHYGGLGLGLYIVRTILEGLGGSVRVESEPDAGATFLIELPLARPT